MAHPGVDIISRDRSGSYADGARRGAPDAVQVADRWHLVHNVREVVEQVLARRAAVLRQAARAVARPLPVADPPSTPERAAPQGAARESELERPARLSRTQRLKQETRARRLARYEDGMTRYSGGMSLSAIARTLGIGRQAVQRYVRAGHFPERRERAPRPTQFTPYEAYLRERWAQGCQDAAALWREIRALGFRGHPASLRQYVRPWRAQPLPPGWPHQRPAQASPPPPPRPPSVYAATWLLLRPPADLADDERAYLTTLVALDPDVATPYAVAQDFLTLVRSREAATLESWLDTAEASGVPELMGFATGRRRDQPAVDAALRLPWSNGQTEGHINRVKTIKRQMYGRANFDLLRLRVLQAA
jgi:transposase